MSWTPPPTVFNKKKNEKEVRFVQLGLFKPNPQNEVNMSRDLSSYFLSKLDYFILFSIKDGLTLFYDKMAGGSTLSGASTGGCH